MLTVRTARPEDAERIAEIYFQSWNRSAEGLLAPDVVRLRTLEYRTARWRKELADGAPGIVLVAETGGEIVGEVRIAPSHGKPGVGEVDSMYVDIAHQRLGIGSVLLRAATEALAAQGFDRAVLWVFAANSAAISFYEKHGWTPTGAAGDIDIHETDAALAAIELGRPLTPGSTPPPVGAGGGAAALRG